MHSLYRPLGKHVAKNNPIKLFGKDPECGHAAGVVFVSERMFLRGHARRSDGVGECRRDSACWRFGVGVGLSGVQPNNPTPIGSSFQHQLPANSIGTTIHCPTSTNASDIVQLLQDHKIHLDSISTLVLGYSSRLWAKSGPADRINHNLT